MFWGGKKRGGGGGGGDPSGQRSTDLALFYLRLGIFARFGGDEERRRRPVLESVSLNLDLRRLDDVA